MPEFELGKSNRSLGSVNLPGTNLIPKLMNFSSYLAKVLFGLPFGSKKSIQNQAQDYTDFEEIYPEQSPRIH